MRQTLRRAYHFAAPHNTLVASCVFSCILLLSRLLIKRDDTYAFLFWNLFLAFVPFVISKQLLLRVAGHRRRGRILIVLMWLLFIPNSFYIVTDFLHFRDITSAPEWFDLLLLLSFAWNGILLGIVSLRNMELYAQKVMGRGVSLVVIGLVMWLNAWGIYIGRFLRYNSWDVIAQPFALFGDMFEMAVNPINNRMEWAMICSYAVFMVLIYITITRISTLLQPERAVNIQS